MIVLAGLVAGPWCAAGFYLPGRTQSAIYLVFLIGWFVTLFVLLRPAAAWATTLRVPGPARFVLGLQMFGVLLTLGFRPGNVLSSFLVEAVLIALLGGVIGCLLALPINGLITSMPPSAQRASMEADHSPH